MVPVHDYVKRYAEAFVITKIRTFKHEPFFIVGGGGGGLIRGTLRYMYVQSLNSSRTTFEPTFVAFYPCIGRRTNVTDHTCIYSVPLVQEWIFSYEDLC